MYIQRLTHRESSGRIRVRAVRILSGGFRQNFTRGFIEGAKAEGWLALKQGRLLLKGEKEIYAYTIMREPGTYCTYCQASVTENTWLAHAATHEESGITYRRIDHYETVRTAHG